MWVCGCVGVWVCKSAVNIHSYSLATLVRASPVKSYGGGARVCVMGGLPPCGLSNVVPPLGGGTPLWSIERSSAVGGRYPPRFAGQVLRRGVRGYVLWGVYPPLWFIEHRCAVGGRYPPPLGGATPLKLIQLLRHQRKRPIIPM